MSQPVNFLPQWWAQCQLDEAKANTIQQEYLQKLTELWSSLGSEKISALQKNPDRRFNSHEWQDGGLYQFLVDAYLINAQAMTQLADAVQTDPKMQRRIQFAVEQWTSAMSPANYLATNPEAQKKIIDSRGESLSKGISNLLADASLGRISMTDESKFEVGKNVANTEGAVVYENDFFQLLQYKPLTATVAERPLLIVPPCINKFYILDLQPENSLVRYAVEQGQTVFIVSWRNPTEECAHWTWDDYLEQGVIKAIHVSSQIAKATFKTDQINALGFCVGGTLLAVALAALAARQQKPVTSLTLLTTFLDFSHTGIMDIFIDEAQVGLREQAIGKGGLMSARELATTFSFLRPNDLVWPYVVANYLKGETPPAFDLLYWNADSTNLPGPMCAWYLRNTYLENNLIKAGKTKVGATKIDLGQLDMPVYVYGSREDHIVPWKSAYACTQVLKNARSVFVLGASGHIAGVINPPAKNKRNYWVAKKKTRATALPKEAQTWFDQAETVPGSWWSHWNTWLSDFQGRSVKAPLKYGGGKYRALEPAPGRYVKVRVV